MYIKRTSEKEVSNAIAEELVMSKMIQIYQVVFNTETKKVQKRINLTQQFKGQYFGFAEVKAVLEDKRDALKGLRGNTYYEISGIDYDSLALPQELKDLAP